MKLRELKRISTNSRRPRKYRTKEKRKRVERKKKRGVSKIIIKSLIGKRTVFVSGNEVVIENG